MKKNMGPIDRTIRMIAGIILLIFALVDPQSNWWGFIGLLPLITSFVGVCPAYLPFGLSTIRSEKK
jgi:sulfite exporter TauE/SafE